MQIKVHMNQKIHLSILNNYIEDSEVNLDKATIKKMVGEIYQEGMWISIMYILTIKGKESKGAYSVVDQNNEQVLYIFEQKDDATRYALQLEDRDYPTMRVMEIEDEIMIRSCELHGHKYAVSTPDDIVFPPDKGDEYDLI